MTHGPSPPARRLCCYDHDTTEVKTMNATNESPGKNRVRTNFWVNVTAALVFAALLGTGLLLEFVLQHGSGGAWLGLHRHGWAEVHLYLSLVLLALMVVHLVLHRAWIVKTWKRFAGSLRSPATWSLVTAVMVLIVLPFLVPPEPGPGNGTRGRHAEQPRHDRGNGRKASNDADHEAARAQRWAVRDTARAERWAERDAQRAERQKTRPSGRRRQVTRSDYRASTRGNGSHASSSADTESGRGRGRGLGPGLGRGLGRGLGPGRAHAQSE